MGQKQRYLDKGTNRYRMDYASLVQLPLDVVRLRDRTKLIFEFFSSFPLYSTKGSAKHESESDAAAGYHDHPR